MWIYEQTKSEESLSLLPQTVGLPVQTEEPALPPVPAQAAEPAEQLTQKSPASRQSATPPRIAGCWLRRFCWGVRQPVCYRPYAMPGRQSCCGIIWKRGKGCLHRAVCRGLYSFRHGIPDTRPCGQPVSGIGAFCPWPRNDLWQYDVVRLGQRAAYGTALRRRRVESNTSGAAMDRLTGGSSKRLSVLFRLRFAGQQPNPRIFFPQASADKPALECGH